MSRWRPAPDDERWLEVASRLRGALPAGALTEQAGHWRSIGLFGRIALFVLGLVAAALLLGILGFSNDDMLLVAGVVAAGAAEWLKLGKRLQASGIEEGLCVAGYLMVGVWFAGKLPPPSGPHSELLLFVVTIATGAAGLRLLNPLLTTCAALAFVEWCGSTQAVRAANAAMGAGMSEFALACAGGAIALAAGVHVFRRPSHDRMLDWLVVALPIYAYVQRAGGDPFTTTLSAPGSLSIRATTVLVLLALGIASFAVGLQRRRHAPLLAALGCIACIAVQCVRASGWPVEAWLVLLGLAAIAVGAGVDRFLRSPRNGVTSARLTDREGPLDLLQTAGAAILAGPASHEAPPDSRGGRFGGGGASGSF